MTFKHSLRSPLSALLIALMLSACGKTDKPAAEAAKPGNSGKNSITIRVAPARAAELQRSVRVVGSLVGLETVSISNRVAGVVSKIHVNVGAWVKPGDKLLEIEPERFLLAQRETEGMLQQTLARLGLSEVPADDFDVNQTAPVKKAKSEYENAKNKYDRATPLNQQHILNDFEYLDIVSKFKSAESALDSSRDEARALVAQARQNRTQIELRRKDAQDSIIVAPDGTTPDKLVIDRFAVTGRKVAVGEYLREGTTLFTLMADSTLKLQTRVPERYLAEIKRDAEVRFKVEAYPNEAFVAKVYIIDPAVDPASRTFLIEALVDNAAYSNRLRPGSFVPGEILTRKDSGRVMVPLEAVTSFVGVTKVFKLDGPDKVKSCDVVTGQQETVKDENGREALWVEIVKGDIKATDTVAVSGLTKLVDKSTVVIDKSQPTPTAATTTSAEAAAVTQ